MISSRSVKVIRLAFEGHALFALPWTWLLQTVKLSQPKRRFSAETGQCEIRLMPLIFPMSNPASSLQQKDTPIYETVTCDLQSTAQRKGKKIDFLQRAIPVLY